MNYEKLMQEIREVEKYTLPELFKIRDALMTLAQYGLEDKDLLFEINKFLVQKERDADYQPRHPDDRR